MDAPVKTTVIVASINVIPADPASNSGLRPTLSISAIATKVISDIDPGGHQRNGERRLLAESHCLPEHI